MSMSAKIVSAVTRSKKSLGDLVVAITVSRFAETSYSSQVVKSTESTLSADGFVGTWELGEVDGTNVRFDDIKFYAFPTDFDFLSTDRVTLNGISYAIVKATPIMAGARTALTILQLRK